MDPDFINQNVSGLGVGKELFGQFYDLSAGGSTDFRSGNAAFHEMLITDDTKKILSKYDQTGYAQIIYRIIQELIPVQMHALDQDSGNVLYYGRGIIGGRR